MRSSKRIIRGIDAAELPIWSIDLIGSFYENKVDRLMSEMNQKRVKEVVIKELSPEEQRLKEWEDALIRREAQLKLLERDTLKLSEEQGHQTGYEAGWKTAHQERLNLIQASKTIEDEFERFKSELSEKLLDLSILVSKKIVADTISLHPEHAALLLNSVLESMQLHSKLITLHAHPETIRTIEAHFGDQSMLGNIRMITDKNQLQGGFLLQHPEGEIDMSLQTRWLKAIEVLGRNTPISPEDLDTDSKKDSD
jgi:flagellar assembly protein FliH